MTEPLAWAISALVGVSTLGFLAYLVGLFRLPNGHRPRTPRYDRLGRFLEMAEKPDYHAGPGQ